MGLIGLASGALGMAGASPQLLTVTSAFSVFMVCSAAGALPPPDCARWPCVVPCVVSCSGKDMHCSFGDDGVHTPHCEASHSVLA